MLASTIQNMTRATTTNTLQRTKYKPRTNMIYICISAGRSFEPITNASTRVKETRASPAMITLVPTSPFPTMYAKRITANTIADTRNAGCHDPPSNWKIIER